MVVAVHIGGGGVDERVVEIKQAGEYITFRVARQDFVMRTSYVRGVLPATEVIPFDSEEFPNRGNICGVASLRGCDLPVIDLQRKLGIARGSHGRQPCVVVVEILNDGAPRLFGFVADRISDVLTLRDRDFKNGAARVNGRTRPVLEPESILTGEELASSLSPSINP